MLNNIFGKNEAYQAGGAVLFSEKIPVSFVKSNYFDHNSADQYGTNYASQPYRVIHLI